LALADGKFSLPVIASEAKQSIGKALDGLLRRFASLAMTAD
jgi:hypothetical protein